MASVTTAQLAEQLGAVLEGNPNVKLTGVAGITEAEEGELSFIHNPKYFDKISSTKASAVIVPEGMETDFRPVIRCKDPYLSFAKAINIIVEPRSKPAPGIHPTAVIGENVSIGREVSIQAQVVIEDGCHISDGVVLYPMVFVGAGSSIGDDSVVHPRVSIGERVCIGADCIIHPGTSIGVEALGGREILSSGEISVKIEDRIEIGSNVVIGMGTTRSTIIGENTKIDNLVQISSNVQVGKRCILVAQTCIGENSELEDHVTMAGQSALRPGVRVGKGATIAAQSIVESDVPGGQVYYGFPAQPYEQEMRTKVMMNRLPNLFKAVRELEKKIKE